MRNTLTRIFAGTLAGTVAVSAAPTLHAADLGGRRRTPPPPLAYAAPVQPVSFVSEVRIGGAAQDPSSAERNTVAVNGEVLFARPQLFQGSFWQSLVPRATVGGSYNTSGRTSYGYAGLTWTIDVFPETLNRRVFVEGFFGGAVHDGSTGPKGPINDTLNALGCNPLFREAAAIGYRIDEHWSVMATVDHMSNAGLCINNRGLTNVGGKIGYTF